MIPKKPQGVLWTDDQWKSIYAKDRDILVAAAAGSGKTAVLVERIIERIIRDEIDVDRLLVVTFTNLSAREMKHRIDARIQKKSLEFPDNEHLKNQRIKIHQAQISTLHSFCLKLIQQHYDVLDIDPNFRTSSEAENVLLLEQTIDDVLEKHYATLDSDFVDVVEQLANDRSDDTLRDMVKKLYYFSVANPNPIDWLTHLSDPYADDTKQEEMLDQLKAYMMIDLKTAHHFIKESTVLFEDLYAVDKHLELLRGELAFMNQAIEGGVIDLDMLSQHELPKRFPSQTKKVKEENDGNLDVYDAGKGYYDAYKALIKDVQDNYLSRDVELLKSDMKALAPRVQYLATLTKDVIETFNDNKRKKNVLDFSDYEHFALKILTNEDGSPSQIADIYRDQFDEILVDEYQDTNRVQEKIISCIKRGAEHNGNLFMVGDVKQSIYKFRQADPSLFIEKYERFTTDIDRKDAGLRIDLSQNFRSRPEVLNTTNFLFQHMMDQTVGEITYDAAQQLYLGAKYDPEQPYPMQFDVMVEDDESELTGTEQEAELIAQRVEHILEHQRVYDSDTKRYRKPTYKDIVILERGYGNARILQQVFKDKDIPFHVNSKSGYFEQTEIRLMLSFLRVIDNPFQDIYLVGLIRSVIYQFTEDELATIQVHTEKMDYFYQSIEQFLEHDTEHKDLTDKLKAFLEDIQYYQDYSQNHPVYQLIDQFYNDKYVIQYFSGLVGGRGRRQNLYGLFNKAVDFENMSFRGLFQFIRFIDELIERGKDFGEENVIGPNDDVVRMMSIHSSKGLEFPFVIYSGLSKSFNRGDIRQQVILNQQYGIGMDYYDLDAEVRYPSLASVLFKAIGEKELISEEMRLMYVALTRAKTQLYLIGRVKAEKELDKLLETPFEKGLISASSRLSAKSPFELIYSVYGQYHANDTAKSSNTESNLDRVDTSLSQNLDIYIKHFSEIQSDDALESDTYRTLNMLDHMKGHADVQAQIQDQLRYEYPYQDQVSRHSKISVSELKRQHDTEETNTNYDRVRQYRLGVSTFDRPQFMQEGRTRRANEIGTLMHTVMEHLPFEKEGMTHEALEQYVDGLVTRDILNADEKDVINLKEVYDFTKSRLYDDIAHSDKIYREIPFIVNQSKVDDIECDDAAVSIIQGMVDLIFVKDGCYYFVDYKTDSFRRRRGMTDEELGKQLKSKYYIQMSYYQQTLEAILNTKVKGYLYFFKFGQLSIEEG